MTMKLIENSKVLQNLSQLEENAILNQRKSCQKDLIFRALLPAWRFFQEKKFNLKFYSDYSTVFQYNKLNINSQLLVLNLGKNQGLFV